MLSKDLAVSADGSQGLDLKEESIKTSFGPQVQCTFFRLNLLVTAIKLVF